MYVEERESDGLYASVCLLSINTKIIWYRILDQAFRDKYASIAEEVGHDHVFDLRNLLYSENVSWNRWATEFEFERIR